MAFSLLVYLFRVRNIYVFIYTNEESADIIVGATKTVQHSAKNISRNIKAEMHLTKKKIQNNTR